MLYGIYQWHDEEVQGVVDQTRLLALHLSCSLILDIPLASINLIISISEYITYGKYDGYHNNQVEPASNISIVKRNISVLYKKRNIPKACKVIPEALRTVKIIYCFLVYLMINTDTLFKSNRSV